jgi:hypothetical protein
MVNCSTLVDTKLRPIFHFYVLFCTGVIELAPRDFCAQRV